MRSICNKQMGKKNMVCNIPSDSSSDEEQKPYATDSYDSSSSDESMEVAKPEIVKRGMKNNLILLLNLLLFV